jgi:hypothetical protein
MGNNQVIPLLFSNSIDFSVIPEKLAKGSPWTELTAFTSSGFSGSTFGVSLISLI